MMQYNPLVTDIIKEMPKVKNYKELSEAQQKALKKELDDREKIDKKLNKIESKKLELHTK